MIHLPQWILHQLSKDWKNLRQQVHKLHHLRFAQPSYLQIQQCLLYIHQLHENIGRASRKKKLSTETLKSAWKFLVVFQCAHYLSYRYVQSMGGVEKCYFSFLISGSILYYIYMKRLKIYDKFGIFLKCNH